MRGSLRAILLAALIVFPLFNLTWPANPGLAMPEHAGQMPLESMKDFEQESPGGGVGWSYRVKYAKADVYLYTHGLTDIPADVNSPIIARHLQEVIGGVYEAQKLGYYTDVKTVTADQKMFIGSQPFFQAELKLTQENIPRVSHIYLGVYEGKFLKIRFTYYLSEASAGKKYLAEFLQSMGKVLDASKKPAAGG